MKQPLLTRRSKRQVPRLNMASMPDLIFSVLFFFMLVTHMRQTDTKVRYELPRGTEVARLAHKQSVVYLYIGRARVYNNKVETGQRTDSSQTDMAGYELQLNNSIVDIGRLGDRLTEERRQMAIDDQAMLTVSLRADRDVPMRIVALVKQKLQAVHALRISYAATKTDEEPKE